MPVPANAPVTSDEANPDAKAHTVEFKREGGVNAWEAAWDNGMDVKVDPISSEILRPGHDD